jgi:hypothetical protein
MDTIENEILKLEVGKKYKLRNGLVTSPLRITENTGNYIYEAEVDEYPGRPVSVLSWLAGGHYLLRYKDNDKDIVELID